MYQVDNEGNRVRVDDGTLFRVIISDKTDVLEVTKMPDSTSIATIKQDGPYLRLSQGEHAM